MNVAPKQKAMIVAGVMSGTSADGVDVTLCRIAPGRQSEDSPRIKIIGTLSTPYSRPARAELIRVMAGGTVTAADLSRLNWRLGQIYADCVERAAAKFQVKVGLVGCHGQTIHHETAPTQFLGSPMRSTWQTGEASVLTERLRCPVISDFRPADLAAGGQGAPLVPMLDWTMFRSKKTSRVLQNLGGIGNLTALPAACHPDAVMAFDTGPGNMVIDGCMTTLFDRKFDRNGAVARRGRILTDVVGKLLGEPYFAAPPPKSCGREEFGSAFVTRFIEMCRKAKGTDVDCVATATALTAESILHAYRQFVWAFLGTATPLAKVEFCVAGGGAKNAALVAMVRDGFAALGVHLRLVDELGIPAQAKEGVAFALLAWLSWHGLPGNIPAATGANRAVVLGKVSIPG